MSVQQFVDYPYVYMPPRLDEHFDHNEVVVADFAEPTEQPWSNVNVCRYFLSGNCRYGDFCRNSHVTESQPEPQTPLQPIVRVDQQQKDTNNNRSCTEVPETTRNWIDAPEFVPRFAIQNTNASSQSHEAEELDEDEKEEGATGQNARVSYAQIVSGNAYDGAGIVYADSHEEELPLEHMAATLCPYIQTTITKTDGSISCRYGERCPYQHGDLCDICGSYCLHPTDQNQRKTHQKECMSMLEKDMEHSFAVARSKDKTCGICFEVITEKAQRGEHRFGILPNCNHIFCLPCIRKWRQAKNFDSTIVRACPECRIESHYVCPSLYWVDTKEEKEKLLGEYKEALRQQHCKYFNKGEGVCPFGNKCFYKHALPNGELVDVGVPQQRRRYDLHGESNIVERVILWNFLQARDDFSDDDDDDDDDDDTISSITDSDID